MNEMSTPHIRIENLTKSFRRRSDGGVVIPVDDVSLDISESELLVLLGPSGCGKTTLLRCIAGLERPDAGEIWIGEQLVYSSKKGVFVPPNKREISMIFQSYALWPHMNIFDNVAYPLRSRGGQRDHVDRQVKRALEMVNLGHLARQYPGQISGGQQQRVALARAVVSDSRLVLFDEPLSNVDAKVREQLRLELAALQAELRFTGVYVTHDQSEAMELADRIAVLRDGRIEQCDTPAGVYAKPASRYVADFIGTANIFLSTVKEAGENVAVSSPIGDVTIRPTDNSRDFVPGEEVWIMIRPQAVQLANKPNGGQANCWPGTVTSAKFVGSHVQYLINIEGQRVQAWSHEVTSLSAGDAVWVSAREADVNLLPDEHASESAELPDLEMA